MTTKKTIKRITNDTETDYRTSATIRQNTSNDVSLSDLVNSFPLDKKNIVSSLLYKFSNFIYIFRMRLFIFSV